MMTQGALRILLIQDNPDDRALILRELRQAFQNLNAQEIAAAREFEEALESGEFDLVITDYKLGWSDGLDILRRTRARFPDKPVIVFTAAGSQEIAVEAMKSGSTIISSRRLGIWRVCPWR